MRKHALLIVSLLLLSVVAACEDAPRTRDTKTATVSVAPTATPQLVATLSPTVEPPGEVIVVLQALARQFHLPLNDVHLLLWERVDWPDSCLGIATRDACTEAIVPGYRLVIELEDDGTYEYHASQDGLLFLMAAGPSTIIHHPALVWEGVGLDRFHLCENLTLAADGTALVGLCSAPQAVLHLADDVGRPAQLAYLLERFAPFEAETPAGRVTLHGRGHEVPSPAWQRAIATWGRTARMELWMGRSGASWAAALAWHRGIAERPGYCRFLAVETYGVAYASVARCDGGDAQELGWGWLKTAEWEQFDTWFYSRSSLQLPGLGFFGVGLQEMSETETEALQRWAETLYVRLASPVLTVEEYPIVAEGVDGPGHMEYWQRIPSEILDRRRGWRQPSAERLVEPYNTVLSPFGYRLVPKEKPGWHYPFYDLYKDDTLVKADLNAIRPISVNGTGDDFALLVDVLNGPTYLVSREAVEQWDQSRHAFIPPVFVGDELIAIEVDEQHARYTLQQGSRTVYDLTTLVVPGPRADNPVKGLWSWDGHWVLEVDGRVIVDWWNLNQELESDEIFGWRLLGGQPLYFFRKGHRIGVSYAGQVLPYHYDEVIHYRCCEAAAFNVCGNETMVWFHALRDGMWYYVEMGVYQSMPR